MTTTLLGWSRRVGAHAFASTLSRCRVLGFVHQEDPTVSKSKVAHLTQSYDYSKHICRYYSSSSPSRLKYCKQEGCGLKARFGLAYDGKPLCCSFHKETSMIDVKNKRCEYPGCDIRPHFGYIPMKGIRCVSHKLPGMIDVISRRCEYDGCKSLNPLFNVPGGKGNFCEKHKKENMIDVRNRKCGHEGCDLRPHLGFPLSRGRLVDNLKLSGMSIQKRTKCKNQGCKEFARLGLVLREPLYCSEHKLADMKDVVSHRSSKHKLEGMIDLNKTCEHKGCQRSASFGMPGSGFQYCDLHKLEGMIQYKGRVKRA